VVFYLYGLCLVCLTVFDAVGLFLSLSICSNPA